MDFPTVDEFLRQANAFKQARHQSINEGVHDHIADRGTVGVPPALGDTIEGLLLKHGDEAYRQIGLFCLGKWFEAHARMAEDNFMCENIAEGCQCLMDGTRISDAIHLVDLVSSFGGDESWRTMLEETVSEAIFKAIEEDNEP